MVEPTPPSARKKEPHELLTRDVKQLSSVDQLLDADLTWLHMRPLYDPRSVDKRAESPTLVKGYVAVTCQLAGCHVTLVLFSYIGVILVNFLLSDFIDFTFGFLRNITS